ncbi:MAG: hypothetical protein P8N76_06510 [Pirellulaceae bacterium]|nr:hypothetical protein [Pirellulaceae bacterium]
MPLVAATTQLLDRHHLRDWPSVLFDASGFSLSTELAKAWFLQPETINRIYFAGGDLLFHRFYADAP